MKNEDIYRDEIDKLIRREEEDLSVTVVAHRMDENKNLHLLAEHEFNGTYVGWTSKFKSDKEHFAGVYDISYNLMGEKDGLENLQWRSGEFDDTQIKSKSSLFRERLFEEILKDEHEYCFDKSYMSDDAWEKQWGDVSRFDRYKEVVDYLNNSVVVSIMADYGDQYDYLYESVRNESVRVENNKDYVVRDTKQGSFSDHKNINVLFKEKEEEKLQSPFVSDYQRAERKHYLKMMSDKERKEYMEIFGYEFNEVTYDLVKQWEEEKGYSFYEGFEEITLDRAEQIIQDHSNDNENTENEGLFFYKSNDGFVVIDNSTGDAWTEEFQSYEYSMDWLKYNWVDVDHTLDRLVWREEQTKLADEGVENQHEQVRNVHTEERNEFER